MTDAAMRIDEGQAPTRQRDEIRVGEVGSQDERCAREPGLSAEPRAREREPGQRVRDVVHVFEGALGPAITGILSSRGARYTDVPPGASSPRRRDPRPVEIRRG